MKVQIQNVVGVSIVNAIAVKEDVIFANVIAVKGDVIFAKAAVVQVKKGIKIFTK